MEDIRYMRRALELAKLAQGKTGTNPMVGSVIVHEGKIIGEGYHRLYGTAHAEVNAINSVRDKSLLPHSTLYVNLEPCSHYGKTPPCCDLIIKHNIKRVVIGCVDSFAKVNGEGIRRLRAHGIEVEVGVLERESKILNRRFFCYHENKRPYIILKWAQTCDGYLDNDRDSSAPMSWLTNQQCKYMVHKMRSQESAILVGSKTVTRDNPSLTTRDWSGANPTRIIIDRELKLSKEYNIFNSSAKTYIVNNKTEGENHIKIDSTNEKEFLHEMMHKLYEKGLTSIITEGGSQVLNMFINNRLYDEATIFISPLSLMEMPHGNGGKGVEAPAIPTAEIESSASVSNIIVKKIIKKAIY